MLCLPYSAGNGVNSVGVDDKTMYIGPTYLYFTDSAYDNISDSSVAVTQFKTDMTNIDVLFEIETPIQLSLNNPMTYKVDKYSTEELIVPTSVSGQPTSTAINADIDYQYRG